MNRDVIKYMAMFTMLLNHIANVFLVQGTWLCESLKDLGYFTAVTMCYFLVEGYEYTHSKKRYAVRLFIFALVSEIPFCLAFTIKGVLSFQGMNMMFTLFICFLIIWALDEIQSPPARILIVYVLIAATSHSDWALLAPVFTILFVWAKGSEKKKKQAFAAAMLLFGFFSFLNSRQGRNVAESMLYAAGCVAGMALSSVCILYLYNGKKMEKGRKFSKWFFYLFYPVHLLILGILRIYLIK